MQLDELGAAHAWLDAAQREYNTAAKYGSLALRLMELDAPVELVARTQQAGLQTVYHHERCNELAQLLGGPQMSPAANDADAAHSNGGHAGVAVDALVHGLVGQSFAINCMRRGMRTAAPEVAATMKELVVEDQSHLGLSRDIVAWCVEQSPGVTVDLHNAARRLPTTPANIAPAMPEHEAGRAGLCSASQATDAWKEAVLEATWWLTTTVA